MRPTRGGWACTRRSSVPGVPDEVLPEYVPRDADAAEFGIRARVAAAAQRGGFVLLVGGSSVGKTRSAAEAVRAVLPDWWLVHPGGPARSPRWPPRRRHGWWCGWMSCSATWTASPG